MWNRCYTFDNTSMFRVVAFDTLARFEFIGANSVVHKHRIHKHKHMHLCHPQVSQRSREFAQQRMRVTVFFDCGDINSHRAIRDCARGRESKVSIDGKCDVQGVLVVEVEGLVVVDTFKLNRTGVADAADGSIHL